MIKYIHVVFAILLVIILSLWVRSYFVHDYAVLSSDKFTRIQISSMHGHIILGKYSYITGPAPSLGIYSSDPDVYEGAVSSVRSVGIEMDYPRDMPYFDYGNFSASLRGDRQYKSTSITFPHWLLASVFDVSPG